MGYIHKAQWRVVRDRVSSRYPLLDGCVIAKASSKDYPKENEIAHDASYSNLNLQKHRVGG